MKWKMRFTIARLMGVVLVMGLGSVALRFSSEDWAGTMLLATCAVLMLAFIGAACRGPGERAWWLGFALFGSGYLAMAHWTSASNRPLPTIALVDFIGSKMGLTLEAQMLRGGQGWEALPTDARIIHCLCALALGLIGSLLAGVLVGLAAHRTPPASDADRADRRPSRRWWKHRAAIGLAGFWILAFAAGVGRWSAPGLWAGASFLMACGLLGLAALAALLCRGRDRAPWLGAALFGFGYLILTFGQSDWLIVVPHLPTERLINSLLRNGGPPADSDFPDFRTARFFRVRNDLIKKKLDLPIAMHFPDETPLAEFLKSIREATRDANFPGIPIYVDPKGLQAAERSMNSTVRIDFDAIAVRDGLRLCLKQLGLGFCVRSGFIMISGEDVSTLPVYEDPLQVVGHSFLAMVAAGLGALAGGFVCGRYSGQRAIAGNGEVRT